MVVKFATIRGSLGSTPYYVAIPQHERVLRVAEAYKYAAEQMNRTYSEVQAVFEALAKVLKANQNKGNASVIADVATFRNYVTGAFASTIGPWVLGKNLLVVNAIEADAFKNTFDGIIPENATKSAKPIINSFMDEVTGDYDKLTRDDVFQISGTDLGPDLTKDDEYVCFVDSDGVEHKATLTLSDLGLVKGYVDPYLPAGSYTCKVYTRCGYEGRGVVTATRKIAIVQ